MIFRPWVTEPVWIQKAYIAICHCWIKIVLQESEPKSKHQGFHHLCERYFLIIDNQRQSHLPYGLLSEKISFKYDSSSFPSLSVERIMPSGDITTIEGIKEIP